MRDQAGRMAVGILQRISEHWHGCEVAGLVHRVGHLANLGKPSGCDIIERDGTIWVADQVADQCEELSALQITTKSG